MAADDFSPHPGDVEAGAEPTLGAAPPRRPLSSAVSRPGTSGRPSTSRSIMSRLQVERIDTVEGGGLSVLGLSLHNHCGVALIVFSAFFLLIGLILAVIAFSNSVRTDLGDDPNRLGFLQRNRNTLRIVGPAMLVSGFVMALCGICFCALNWKVKQEEKEKEVMDVAGYHCPLHDPGDRPGSRRRSHNSVSSALPLGIATEGYGYSRNSFQASGGCDLCYERAKTAKSIEEYEEMDKYLNTMGRDDFGKGVDIACFPRPITPNNNSTSDFSLPGSASNGVLDAPMGAPDGSVPHDNPEDATTLPATSMSNNTTTTASPGGSINHNNKPSSP